MLGCVNFALTLGHLIWIIVLRFRPEGKVVTGDYLEDDAPEVDKNNYIINHGRFALVYLILTGVVFAVISVVGCVACCIIIVKTNQK